MTIPAADYIRAIAPYQPGMPISELARRYGLDESSIVKLASNENPFGMPEGARAAAIACLAEGARYPDGNGFDLKQALSAVFDVPPDWITLGNGSNDILEIAARALLHPGVSAVYSAHAFAVYPLATQASGARSIVVPARRYGHDLDAMAAAIAPDTRVVFIANPNNPTGTFVPAAEVEAFLDRVPKDVVVVLDEAYNEYLDEADRFDSTRWLAGRPNLLVSRTFSKAYGLASLRVGYGLAQPELTDLLNRVRQPFNVSTPALVAAEAALADRDFVARARANNRSELDRLEGEFRTMGIEFLPSFGNFSLLRVGDAAAVYEGLLRAGVIVRPVAGYGLPEWLRVSVGLPAENDRFLAALRPLVGR